MLIQGLVLPLILALVSYPIQPSSLPEATQSFLKHEENASPAMRALATLRIDSRLPQTKHLFQAQPLLPPSLPPPPCLSWCCHIRKSIAHIVTHLLHPEPCCYIPAEWPLISILPCWLLPPFKAQFRHCFLRDLLPPQNRCVSLGGGHPHGPYTCISLHCLTC